MFIKGDGNIRIWKDYTVRGRQRLVSAFSSIQGHRPGVRSVSAVVDWQQQSGYLVIRVILAIQTLIYECTSTFNFHFG